MTFANFIEPTYFFHAEFFIFELFYPFNVRSIFEIIYFNLCLINFLNRKRDCEHTEQLCEHRHPMQEYQWTLQNQLDSGNLAQTLTRPT